MFEKDPSKRSAKWGLQNGNWYVWVNSIVKSFGGAAPANKIITAPPTGIRALLDLNSTVTCPSYWNDGWKNAKLTSNRGLHVGKAH